MTQTPYDKQDSIIRTPSGYVTDSRGRGRGLIGGCFIRKARKQWVCDGDGSSFHRHVDGCPRDIAPGDRHVEYVGEVAAYQSGSRHSLACAYTFLAERSAVS